MAKVKVQNTNLDQNLNGTNFNNMASETIFQFGSFAVTSNFAGRKFIDYSNSLSSFVRPVTLETLGLNDAQSAVIHQYQINAVLNLDKSNLNTYVKFGSTYEFFRVAIQEIILKYPGSLFADSTAVPSGNLTAFDITFDQASYTTRFKVPASCIENTFGLIYNEGNSGYTDTVLKNVNVSYEKYAIWSKYDPNNLFAIIGFTGESLNNPTASNYLCVMVETFGNPFAFNTGNTGNLLATGYFDFHIRPNNIIFEEFRALLTDYEQYIVAQRDSINGFQFNLSDPTLLDDGNIVYSTVSMLWTTSDGYNVDISTPAYQRFLTALLTIGSKYDAIKTDLIARFLTPTALKTYDLTEEGKMTKLLRVYGWEFDQLKKFIDSLVNINVVTYNKLNNIPDQLVSNLARTFGWEYFTLVNESQLVSNFLSIDNTERNLTTDLLPAEINIELWRRILINTNYFWKSKGTRQAIKSMFLLIGIPEPFINITEYVYTVNGKINPNTVPFTAADFPTNSLPYDNSGYPQAPIESNYFYFQVSGNTDSGQAYLDVFRKAGFGLIRTVDNKKSWIQTGATTRIHYSTPQYYQEDSRLVINTKEVDVALDTARGIEYDVYDYIQKDFKYNSSGYTLPFSYINISLGYTGLQNTFTLPAAFNKAEGDLEVRFNGILLNGPKEYNGGTGSTYQELVYADYTVSGNTFTLTNSMSAISNNYRRDVIQATYVYSGGTTPVTGITVQYMVSRVSANLVTGSTILLPSMPRGDVQVTMNGIALTKGTPQFIADYIVDPNNTPGASQIIIQNPEFISYFASLPANERFVQVAYIEVNGSNDITSKSEVTRVDSFNSSKIYFNLSANKYVYKMNYKANNARDLKVMIDGIALEPPDENGNGGDYGINVMNPYEIFLPKGIKYGSVISVYYLVGGNTLFTPVVANSFGVGDISQLSFLEFIELIQRRLINAKNRKTISDFKGGWYPALLNVYIQYLIRGQLPEDNILHSNGYTFENLYPFLSKYNSFFQMFVDQLLSATIILKQGGLLVRNTVFTKQKFMYRRGVNLYASGSTTLDTRGLPMVKYLGDDGSTFLINQEINAPTTTVPTVTTNAITSILQTTATGGGNVISSGGAYVNARGIVWDTNPNPTIALATKTTDGADIGAFTSSLTSLSPGTYYYVRAYATNSVGTAYGSQVTFTSAAVVVIPGLKTAQGTAGIGAINTTGGESITGYTSIQFYAMQYRVGTSGSWSLFPTSPLIGPLGSNYFITSITGLSTGTLYTYRAYMKMTDNSEYYGQIRQLTTSAALTLPTVTTGAVNPGLTNPYSLTIDGNQVTFAGNPPEFEHGLVWGASPNPTMPSVDSDTNYPNPYGVTMSGLMPSNTYHARAYACNTVGVAYGGDITVSTPALPKQVNLYPYAAASGTDGGNYRWECYCLESTPAMAAGECYCVCLHLPLYVSPQLVNVDGLSCSSYCVYCKGVSMPGFVLLSSCDLYSQQCSPYTSSNASFKVCLGDTVRILQKAVTKSGQMGKGGTNSCSCIYSVTPIVGSFEVGSVCCSSCAYSG